MARVIVKNTFISFDENAEEDVCSSPYPTTRKRASSAECTPTGRNLQVQGFSMMCEDRIASQIEGLNRLWSPAFHKPLMMLSPRSQATCPGLCKCEPSYLLQVPDSWLAISTPAGSSNVHRSQQREPSKNMNVSAVAPHYTEDTGQVCVPKIPSMQKLHRTPSSNSMSTMASNSMGTSSDVASDVDNTFEHCLSSPPTPAMQDSRLLQNFQPLTTFPKSEFNSKKYHHKSVPKHVNLKEEYANTIHEAPPTTLMIRNIPNCYTQKELINELEELGFACTFDFLYLPLDQGRWHRRHGPRSTMSSVGYAFVNFVDNAWAEKFMAAFQNYKFKKHGKNVVKIASVNVAHIQGLEANLDHYENAVVQTAELEKCKPWFSGKAS